MNINVQPKVRIHRQRRDPQRVSKVRPGIMTAAGRLAAKLQEWISGRSCHLISFDNHIAEQRIKTRQFIGQQTVPLVQIQGSMNSGRCLDFDAHFRLINPHGRERWENVARAWRTHNLPPISLTQVGDIYFVQDGHHRVSIAVHQEQSRIEARVTVIELAEASEHQAHR